MIQVVVGPFTHHSAAEAFSLEFGILTETKTMAGCYCGVNGQTFQMRFNLYFQTDVGISYMEDGFHLHLG